MIIEHSFKGKIVGITGAMPSGTGMDIFGKNVVLGKLDIAKHFSKSLKLNGPQSIEDEVDFKLPDGSIRIMDVEVVSYDLKLLKDMIIVSTSLGFKIKE